jgi:hypothetical protein
MLRKIYSGGETGVEQAALDTAIKLDIPYGGWIPKGRPTENGPLPEHYHLIETSSSTPIESVENNVLHSQGTLILTEGALEHDLEPRITLCRRYQKPCLHIDLETIVPFDAAKKINSWLIQYEIETLYVTGAAASRSPTMYKTAMDLLEAVSYLLIMASENPDLFDVPTDSDGRRRRRNPPSSVDEAVKRLIDEIPLRERAAVARMEKGELDFLQEKLGDYVKNTFMLWLGNKDLMHSCRVRSGTDKITDDQAAATIIEALWEELRKTHRLRPVD